MISPLPPPPPPRTAWTLSQGSSTGAAPEPSCLRNLSPARHHPTAGVLYGGQFVPWEYLTTSEVVLVSVTTGRECHWLPRRLLDVLHSTGHLPVVQNDPVSCPPTPDPPARSSGLWT